MSSTYRTRGNVAAGRASPPTPIYESAVPSPVASPPGSPQPQPPAAVSRPVTPDVLYSTVVMGSPAPPVERGFTAGVVDTSGAFASPPSSPQREVDNGVSGRDDGADDGSWTPVTRATARTHRAAASSLHSNVFDENNFVSNASDASASTVAQATHQMSGEELLRIARRYELMAAEARAVARERSAEIVGGVSTPSIQIVSSPGNNLNEQSTTQGDVHTRGDESRAPETRALAPTNPITPSGEGPSNPDKGKGIDPREWGNLSIDGDWSEDRLAAERDAYANFDAINRIVKEERQTLPPNSFNDSPSLKTSEPPKDTAAGPDRGEHLSPPDVKRVSIRPIKPEERIKGLEEMVDHLMRKLNESAPEIPMWKPSRKGVKQTALDGATKSLHGKSPKAPNRGATPSRIAAGSFIARAIHGAPKAASGSPNPDPSDSSDRLMRAQGRGFNFHRP
ncbi:hypothetical protein GGX14DRAFT_637148 [Mycena pura]|uniref:Uncharacterized protein n=1 Tax=Mycena pura TaxID=153505 RepID=A0AAD6VDT0_9AGAR|nr:hypothetical protein GGX14DRAFT_637148 [Mycena pura]